MSAVSLSTAWVLDGMIERVGWAAMWHFAAELGKRKVETPRGGAWHPQLVKLIVEQLDVGT